MGLTALWSKWRPRAKVYFPKHVVINNPKLALVYWALMAFFLVLAGQMFFSMQQYSSKLDVYGEVSVLPWKLERRLSQVKASIASDGDAPHCNDPDHFDYLSASSTYSNITCAKLCTKATAGTPCVHPRDSSFLEGPSAVFVPTFFTQEVLSPSVGATTLGHFFVPGVEEQEIAFRHRLMVPTYTDRFFSSVDWLGITWLNYPARQAISTDATDERTARIKTVFLDKDGSIKREFQPGEVITVTVAEILQSAKFDEYVDTVSRFSLDDHYVRIEEGIVADRDHGIDRGPTARLTGTKITFDLHYTDASRCALDPSSPPKHDFPDFDGYICCMHIKAARSWTTLDRSSVVSMEGAQINRRYHGLRVKFETYGQFRYLDSVRIWEWLTIFLIWSQIPMVILYYFINNLLGNLSEVYRHVVHQSMNMADVITGLGARVIAHSAAWLDMREQGVGIPKHKLLARFRHIFLHSDDLDPEEISRFVDFVWTGMLKDSQSTDAEQDRDQTLNVQAYVEACCSNEPLSFQSLVQVFDVNRRLGFFERIFNDISIGKLRSEAKRRHGGRIAEESEENRQLNSSDSCPGNSQLEQLMNQREAHSARLSKIKGKLEETMEQLAQDARFMDKVQWYEKRRQDLATMGPREKRAPKILQNGSTYEGEWVGTCRHGYGVETRTDGSKYEGDWSADVRHGNGVHRLPNGAKYDGPWVNGKRHGFGYEVSEDGSRYEGEFVKDCKSGQGEFHMNDGATYKGDVLDNKMHGQGLYRWSIGHVYDGQWQRDHMHGNGTYTFANGMSYEGQHVDNCKHGFGVFTWPDGRRYEGGYKKNERDGKGIFWAPDGTKFEGTWVDGKHHGGGTVSTKDGKSQAVTWNMGVRVNEPRRSSPRASNL